MSKIPPHAKRVFKGIIYDVYHWDQELFDGSTATFEALKRNDTVVVVPLDEDGAVYYALQEQPGRKPFLSLFGGRGEEGEAPLEIAQRELMEETGFESHDWHLLRSFKAPSKIDWTIHIFVARNCKKVGETNLDSGEKIEVRSTTLDDFLKNIVTDPTFAEYELRREINSAFNQEAFDNLKKNILGE